MKIPSFMRIPSHRRFHFEPRHYDPIKEDIKNRTEKIEQDIKKTHNVAGVKNRISETFTRDKYKSSPKVNFLQIILVFVISATFIGFVYIGFYAFLIAGGLIALYVMHQRGVFDRKTTSVIEKTQIKKSSSNSQIAGQIREGLYFPMERSARKNGTYKLFILLGALLVAVAYYLNYLNETVAFLSIFILLILFIRQSNRNQ